MITENEKKIIRTLLFSFGELYSLNEIARKCKIAPNGAYKIVRKFIEEGIVNSKKIGNMNSYALNFSNPKTKNLCELSIIENSSSKIKNRENDLKELKGIAEIAIIFGSYIAEKANPNDIDLFFMLKKENFRKYKEKANLIYPAMPLKVQDVLQTEEDLKNNLSKKDEVIKEILRKGFILWGHDKIVDIIKWM
jgi:DNA-binding Lrp family transcriptional regulator